MNVNGYIIEIEGIDKTGKDLLKLYINKLGNYKYVVQSRGILSNMVYAEKYSRNYNYKIIYKPIIIYLDATEEDRLIRCYMHNESDIDSDYDRSLFEKYIEILLQKGIIIWRYNTSEQTPYSIAKDVLNKLEKGIFNESSYT